MNTWLPTSALARALGVGFVGLIAGALLGQPALVVLAAPLALCGLLGVVRRPRGDVAVDQFLSRARVTEGQGITMHLTPSGDAEQMTWVTAPASYIAVRPGTGVSQLCEPVEVLMSPRRWGRRGLGEVKVLLGSPWGGYAYGPISFADRELLVAPAPPAFDATGEVPEPRGLVGIHQARRRGSGGEFAGIAPFRPGDRLRRIDWRVSLRARELHVDTSHAELDTEVLVLVDAIADVGDSEGIGGRESSLDRTVRAAAAVAAHQIRLGDRVGLKVVGSDVASVGYRTGRGHLERILGSLARVRPLRQADDRPRRLDLRVNGGTVVVALTPLLSPTMVATVGNLIRRRVPLLVVDTLPEDVEPVIGEDADARVLRLAWRMRLIERRTLVEQLAGVGCTPVPWGGPGSLDVALRALVRRGAGVR